MPKDSIPTCKIDIQGNKAWILNGMLHRTDGPAIEYANGAMHWYQRGKLHRTDGPAAIEMNTNMYWYIHGELHRTDGPAITYFNGAKQWYLNGKRYIKICMYVTFTPPLPYLPKKKICQTPYLLV